jgi:hypothetical protein
LQASTAEEPIETLTENDTIERNAAPTKKFAGISFCSIRTADEMTKRWMAVKLVEAETNSDARRKPPHISIDVTADGLTPANEAPDSRFAARVLI